jgi:hypothetical protein
MPESVPVQRDRGSVKSPVRFSRKTYDREEAERHSEPRECKRRGQPRRGDPADFRAVWRGRVGVAAAGAGRAAD